MEGEEERKGGKEVIALVRRHTHTQKHTHSLSLSDTYPRRHTHAHIHTERKGRGGGLKVVGRDSRRSCRVAGWCPSLQIIGLRYSTRCLHISVATRWTWRNANMQGERKASCRSARSGGTHCHVTKQWKPSYISNFTVQRNSFKTNSTECASTGHAGWRPSNSWKWQKMFASSINRKRQLCSGRI